MFLFPLKYYLSLIAPLKSPASCSVCILLLAFDCCKHDCLFNYLNLGQESWANNMVSLMTDIGKHWVKDNWTLPSIFRRKYNRHSESCRGLTSNWNQVGLHCHNGSLAILRGNRKILYLVLFSRLPSHPCISFHFPYTEDSLEENTYLISTYRIAWKNSLFCCQNWFTLGIPLINYYSFLLVPVTVFSYIKYFERKITFFSLQGNQNAGTVWVTSIGLHYDTTWLRK